MNLADIRRQIQDSIDTQLAVLQTASEQIEAAGKLLVRALREGGTVYFMGNGGSAADAQHLAAELEGRYLKDRKPLASIALTTNSSILTAIGNDYGFESVFARQVEATCRAGDVVFGISTSGRSPNVINGLRAAKQAGARTIGLSGEDTSRMKPHCDLVIAVPSHETPRIQESHIVIGHIVCDYVESTLFDERRPGRDGGEERRGKSRPRKRTAE